MTRAKRDQGRCSRVKVSRAKQKDLHPDPLSSGLRSIRRQKKAGAYTDTCVALGSSYLRYWSNGAVPSHFTSITEDATGKK